MSKLAILAPVPVMHLKSALHVLAAKDFVLFGSENWGIFDQTAIGSPVFIYLSLANAVPEVSYVGVYQGLVKDSFEMLKLEKAGYRPESTSGEKGWGCYWKVNGIAMLDPPRSLGEFQLASGKYLSGIPRGPLHVRN